MRWSTSASFIAVVKVVWETMLWHDRGCTCSCFVFVTQKSDHCLLLPSAPGFFSRGSLEMHAQVFTLWDYGYVQIINDRLRNSLLLKLISANEDESDKTDLERTETTLRWHEYKEREFYDTESSIHESKNKICAHSFQDRERTYTLADH